MTSPARTPTPAFSAARRWPGLTLTPEQLLLAASLWWGLTANRGFVAGVLQGHEPAAPATWGLLAALAVLLVALHWLLLAVLTPRPLLKPVLAVLLVASALATHFTQSWGVFIDPAMVRNALHTDLAEARELLSWALLPHLLLHAALPLALLWRVRLRPRPLRQAVLWRGAGLMLAGAAAALALWAAFQPLASTMRNHRALRYLVTPANLVWAVANVATQDTRQGASARLPIGTDARPGPLVLASQGARSLPGRAIGLPLSAAQAATPGARPRLVVLVVGETARAANWGLSGYARQTTPQLAALLVINFGQVEACGTSTEVSLPCMFAPVGRRDYDEARIRGSESLLHVVARAGVGVHWRDNQSGCKGVCDGLPGDSTATQPLPGLCTEGRCLDEALLDGLDARLDGVRGTQFLVLHMLGNHGPSYFRRYPPAFARFQPACASDDLHDCSREAIVNAYDNALLYTDHVLATLIGRLQARAGMLDTAVVYVSDHGESLGENGLYLHGLPRAIAPQGQTRVPMLMWLSEGFARAATLDTACLRRRAAEPAAHDHLFHTLLGLIDVRSAVYAPALDLTAACRGAR